MKKILYFVFIFFAVCEVNSQNNLVLNPSFEEYTQCPDNSGQINLVLDWYNFSFTPEYFNACSLNQEYSVPNNFYGSYQPASTGVAYAGVFTYYSNWPWSYNSREHIAYELNNLLIIGKEYQISFKTSLAYNGFSATCVTNKIGAKLTTNSYSLYAVDSLNSPLVNNFAHIYTDSIIRDSINWTTISGNIIADSAYKYLVIGNFFMDINTDTISLVGGDKCQAYYYIDDVSIIEKTNNLVNVEEENNIIVSFINEKIVIKNNHFSVLDLEIFTYEGKKVFSDKIFNKNIELSLKIDPGIYYIILNNKISKKINVNN